VRFASLGSGSSGNALVIEAGRGAATTRILLDCGFSARETERRLARLGIGVEALDALLITHEHSDHTGSALTLARRLSLPLYASWGTACAMGADAPELDLHVLESDRILSIGELAVRPYTVPHDAREPLQFVFSDGANRLGVLTDAGEVTAHISAALAGCDALVLECNHDLHMLAQSRYPAALKARISGPLGHLSNDAAAGLLASLDCSRLRYLVAAHLSEQNNTPECARAALALTLGNAPVETFVASQDEGFGWLLLG